MTGSHAQYQPARHVHGNCHGSPLPPCTASTTVTASRARAASLSKILKKNRTAAVALLASLMVVHCDALISVAFQPPVQAAAPSARKKAATAADTKMLTPAAADMRDAILDAVNTGLLEDLRHAIELNELKPDFEAPAGADPIAHLKTLSRDGAGADLLAVLGALLASEPATEALGKDAENPRVYVWPAFMYRTPAGVRADDTQLLEKLLPQAEAAAALAGGRYVGWELRIGADGVWHSFKRTR